MSTNQPIFTVEGDKFVLQGLSPSAVKAIALNGPLAKQLADVTLHQADLDFANGCLDGINLLPAEPQVLREALWRAAIVHVMKCFGGSVSRAALPERSILKGHPPEAMIAFSYFKDLRHKYIAHDENAYAQAMPLAVLNDGTGEKKVEQIMCVGALAHTLEQANYSNLKLLIAASLEYTRAKFDDLRRKITEELETTDYADLIKRPPPIYRAPSVPEVSDRRPPI